MKYLVTALLLLFTLPAISCLNLYGEDIHGHGHEMSHRLFNRTAFKPKDIEAKMKALNNKISFGAYTYRDISDYGAYLLMAGKYAEGLTLFQALYPQHANEYTIVQNLGTAYELNGMPDSAFVYIKKGYMLNRASHEGSEWLHIRYLESVLSKKDIDYNKNIFLDTLTFAAKSNTRAFNLELDELFRHVNDQLNERIPFTLGKDDLLAKLLVEMGDLYAEKLSVTREHICYLYAKHFNSNPVAETRITDRINRVIGAMNRSMSTRLNREYGYAYADYRKVAKRKPLNTKGWTFIPVQTLVRKLENVLNT